MGSNSQFPYFAWETQMLFLIFVKKKKHYSPVMQNSWLDSFGKVAEQLEKCFCKSSFFSFLLEQTKGRYGSRSTQVLIPGISAFNKNPIYKFQFVWIQIAHADIKLWDTVSQVHCTVESC